MKKITILTFSAIACFSITAIALILVQNFVKSASATTTGMVIWQKDQTTTLNANLNTATPSTNQFENKPDTKIVGNEIIMENYSNQAPNNVVNWYKSSTNQEWRYRKCYNFQNAQNQAITNQAVTLNIDSLTLVSQNKSLSSGADVRVVDGISQALPFSFSNWNNSSTNISIKISMLANETKTVCVYYGYIPYFETSTLPTTANNLNY
jgi:hypothetical protein